MKKRELLFMLLMAIVMMAMSPTKVWAADVTYSQTGSKAVIKFKEYYSVSGSIVNFWKTSPVLYIDGTSVLTISDLWNTTDFLSRYTSSHSENVISNEDLDKKQKEITLNNVVIGTAKLQNRSQSVSTYTTTYYIELHLTFNDKFSFYGHQIDLKDGVYASYTSKTGVSTGTKQTTTAYMPGYPRPANITANQHGISWEAEKYNDDTNTSGNWLIYRGTTYLGYTTYGTTSFTDTNASCNSTNTYTVVFLPANWTTKKDINGLNASQSVTIGHAYGNPTWTWANDGKTATCKRTCTNTSCTSSTTGHTASATVTLSGGGITSAETTAATCVTKGETTYTAKATVLDTEYTDSKIVADIPALGHTYGEATWEWSDDGKTATCSRTCTNTNCTESTTDHTVSATVTLGEGGITSAVSTPATCLTMGKTTYTAKATVAGSEYTDTKIVTDVPAAGHTYGEPVWAWTGYESATCTRTCTACTEGTEGHTASADVTLGGGGITYAVTTPAQCLEPGSGRYTATATVAGSEYSDYKDKDIPATGHTTPENYDADGKKSCTVCNTFLEYQPLGEADADGWYNISNPRQLKDFAEKVNRFVENINGRLTKDIDMQGITDCNPIYYTMQMAFLNFDNNIDPTGFKGTFDGQGHVISNLTITPNQYKVSVGLFGKNSGTICNLGLKNFYYNNNGSFDGRFAAIAGVNFGTIRNCYVVQSQVSSSNHVCGAIAGGNYGGTIENCYEFGNQIDNASRCGHLVGDANNDNKSLVGIIKNCYSDGKLGNEGQSRYPGGGQTGEAKLQASHFNSGYVTYNLNGGYSGKTDGTQAWYQNLKIDEEDEDFDNQPVLKSTGSNTVYCTYGETCTDQTFNNNGGSGTPNHEYEIAWSWAEDGKTAKATHTCQRNSSHVIETVATVTSQQTLAPTCGAKGETTYTAKVNVIGTEQTDTKTLADIPATGNHVVPDNYDAYGYKYCSSCQNNIPMPLGDADANGWYSLSNAAQLTLFANKVNAGETSIKGRLANDIDMQGQTVVQIGADSEKPFHGELDGQYHAIKNLSINADAEYKASLIGYADKVTIQKLTVQGTINSSSKFATGFIGQTKNNPSKIQKCISAVDIIATINGDGTHAGFVGVASAKAELSDCAFVGSITSENGTNNCAALVGWDNATSSAQNCYVTATFTNGICQNPLIRNRVNDFPTCYYLNTFINADGTPLTSVQGNQITNQQLTNGELCYLLNGGVDYKTDGTQAWYQKIGTDDSPVLKAATGNTVYCAYGETCEDRTYNNTAASGTPNHTCGSSITWKWASDCQSATATYTCGLNSSHHPVVDATITSAVKNSPTCMAMGTTTYTAKINIAGTDYTNNKDAADIATIDHILTQTADDEIKSCTMCLKKMLSATKVSVNQNSTAIETAQIENTDARPVFQFKDGKVVMTLGEGSAHIAEMPLADGAKMTIKGVTYNEETNKTMLSVSSAGYATFSSAFQFTVPDNEGINIYAPEIKEDGNIHIGSATKLPANTVVPAATGLLVKGNEGSYDIAYSSTEAPEVSSVLTASVVARPATDFSGKIYALGYDATDGIGFYRFIGTKTDARKALLVLPSDSKARIAFVSDDIVTGVSNVNDGEQTDENAPAYNLTGQRVNSNARGIIIKNGKKHINK